MEIKLVINIKGNKAIIGAQAPGCDPVLETVEGNLAEILTAGANLIETAQKKWETTKQNPKIDIPREAPKEAIAATNKSKAKPVPTRKASDSDDSPQQALF